MTITLPDSRARGHAGQAKTEAESAAGLAGRIPFHIQYAWAIVITVIIVIAGAIFFVRRR